MYDKDDFLLTYLAAEFIRRKNKVASFRSGMSILTILGKFFVLHLLTKTTPYTQRDSQRY